MRLVGKVAIITGAGRGLGRAIAVAMSQEGARVTLMSRSSKELKAVQYQISGWGGESLVFKGDVSRETDVENMVKKTLAHFSTVDILVNNAAVLGPARFIADADSEAWKRTMDINLNGAFYCSAAVIPIMMEQGAGKIISISSGLGQRPYPRFCAYAVSKAGIIQLTRSLSEELKGHNIQVNAIDPGVMDTNMQEQIRNLGASALGQPVYERFAGLKEMGQLKDPSEVAPLSVFLASSDSDHITGHIGTLSDYGQLGWRL